MELPVDKQISKEKIEEIIKYVESLNKKRILVEDIQDIIEQKLMEFGKYDLAKIYIIYRYTRMLVRKSNTTDESILSIIKNSDDSIIKEKLKKDYLYVYEHNDLIATEVSKDLTRRVLLSEDVTKSIDNGAIYFHDLGYFIQHLICSSILDIKYILENDMFVHGYKLKKPTDIVSACSNLGKVILECASSQTKDITIDLKYFLDMLDKDYALGIKVLFDIISSFISVRGHVAIVNFILNVESEKLINFYLEFLKEYSVFDADKEYCPRLIYVLDENTSDVNSKFYKVTKAVIDLSMEGYPINYFSNKKMLTYYQGKMILPINFNRMMLPYKNKEGEYQTLGRFDQGMVSVNLNQIGLSCSDDEEFFKLLDEKLDIAIEALMSKYFNLLGTDCNSNAVAFRYGAIMVCLNKNIDEYLKDNYSCLCLGLSGLYDLVTNYKKIDFYSEDSFKFITLVISYINKRIELLRKQTKIGFMVVLDDDYLANLNFLMKDKENLSYKGDLVYQNLPIVKDIDELRFQGIIQDLMKGNCVIRLDIENKDVDYLIKYIYENIFYVTLKTGNEIKEE